MTEMTQAARDVLAERQRQVETEGWTPAHDDQHDDGDLARAAACYAKRSARLYRGIVDLEPPPGDWPWEGRWWKPKDARRDLVRAGALILAEIERLDRSEASHD
jgi:hypothetical protein